MNILAALATAAAAAASFAALALTIEQFTQRSRMRRIAEWTTLQATDEANANRAAALGRIRAWAAGQVVATIMVPGRFFTETAIWLAVVPYVVISQARSSNLVPAALFGAFVMWVPFRRAIRVYLERYRIVSEYFRGASVEPMKTPYELGGGPRSELAWAGLLSIGTSAIAFGIALLIRSSSAPWGEFAIVAGSFAIAVAGEQIRKRTPPVLNFALAKKS